MIEVAVRVDHISVLGHAGYAEYGKDIVCAGVTALVQTLIKSIKDLTKSTPEYLVASGEFYMKTGNLPEKARLLVDSFFIGICSIADEFPGYVRII